MTDNGKEIRQLELEITGNIKVFFTSPLLWFFALAEQSVYKQSLTVECKNNCRVFKIHVLLASFCSLGTFLENAHQSLALASLL